jgi:hypothetical protein
LQRAERIYETYTANRHRITWKDVAQAAGVTERAANAWGKTGGLKWEHCRAIAEELWEVDPGWLWAGSPTSPDGKSRSAAHDGDSAQMELLGRVVLLDARLGGIEDKIDQLLARTVTDGSPDASGH